MASFCNTGPMLTLSHNATVLAAIAVAGSHAFVVSLVVSRKSKKQSLN